VQTWNVGFRPDADVHSHGDLPGAPELYGANRSGAVFVLRYLKLDVKSDSGSKEVVKEQNGWYAINFNGRRKSTRCRRPNVVMPGNYLFNRLRSGDVQPGTLI
jgi:hypothetical protein